MPVIVLMDASLTVNSVNLSSFVKKVSLKVEVDDVETTAMGATSRARVGGLRDGSLEIEFNQDFAAGAVDATLWTALGSVVTFAAKATTATTSSTNPQYSGSVLITEHVPLDAGVGELASVQVSWPVTGAVTRAVV